MCHLVSQHFVHAHAHPSQHTPPYGIPAIIWTPNNHLSPPLSESTNNVFLKRTNEPAAQPIICLTSSVCVCVSVLCAIVIVHGYEVSSLDQIILCVGLVKNNKGFLSML